MRNAQRQVAGENSDVESEEEAEAPTGRRTNYLVQDESQDLGEPLNKPSGVQSLDEETEQ